MAFGARADEAGEVEDAGDGLVHDEGGGEGYVEGGSVVDVCYGGVVVEAIGHNGGFAVGVGRRLGVRTGGYALEGWFSK